MTQLENSLENLHVITGHYYEFLDGLSEKGIPLVTPEPNSITAWSATAAKQNYQLQAQHYSAEVSKANIGVTGVRLNAQFRYPGFLYGSTPI